MTITNSGNGYKFKAIMKRRSNPETVTLQRLLKNGKWGKPTEYKLYGSEKTAEDVIARLERNNAGDTWRKAE